MGPQDSSMSGPLKTAGLYVPRQHDARLASDARVVRRHKLVRLLATWSTLAPSELSWRLGGQPRAASG